MRKAFTGLIFSGDWHLPPPAPALRRTAAVLRHHTRARGAIEDEHLRSTLGEQLIQSHCTQAADTWQRHCHSDVDAMRTQATQATMMHHLACATWLCSAELPVT